jgi:leucine-rich repeat protein SHOC2
LNIFLKKIVRKGSKNIIRVLPDGISLLTNLTILNLDNNSICFTWEICALTNLTCLLLNGNIITSLPADIGLLTQLGDLRLNNNYLTSLPNSISLLTNLCEIDISFNYIKHIPNQLALLTYLECIYIDKRQEYLIPKEIPKTKIEIVENDDF